MRHIELLKCCHDYLRGVVTNVPEGRYPIDPDKLAKEINNYLNDLCSARPVASEPTSFQPEPD